MALFPMFLKLEGRSCLVVGAGRIAKPKIRSLLAAGAAVRVVAPEARAAVVKWAATGVLTWRPRTFKAQDLDKMFLVIAATGTAEVNDLVFREAQRRGILCNAVDDPQHCDFYFPAVVRRGDLQIAVSTAGRSPALAQRLGRELRAQFSPEYEGWLEYLGRTRDRLLKTQFDPEQRRQILHSLAAQTNFESWRVRVDSTEESSHEK